MQLNNSCTRCKKETSFLTPSLGICWVVQQQISRNPSKTVAWENYVDNTWHPIQGWFGCICKGGFELSRVPAIIIIWLRYRLHDKSSTSFLKWALSVGRRCNRQTVGKISSCTTEPTDGWSALIYGLWRQVVKKRSVTSRVWVNRRRFSSCIDELSRLCIDLSLSHSLEGVVIVLRVGQRRRSFHSLSRDLEWLTEEKRKMEDSTEISLADKRSRRCHFVLWLLCLSPPSRLQRRQSYRSDSKCPREEKDFFSNTRVEITTFSVALSFELAFVSGCRFEVDRSTHSKAWLMDTIAAADRLERTRSYRSSVMHWWGVGPTDRPTNVDVVAPIFWGGREEDRFWFDLWRR